MEIWKNIELDLIKEEINDFFLKVCSGGGIHWNG